MKAAYNLTPINYPNIAVMPPNMAVTQPFGEFVATPADEKYFYEQKIAEVQSKDLYLPNFSMRVSEGQFSRDVVFNNLGEQGLDLFGSCFILKGEFATHSIKGGDSTVSFSGSQNFKYDPNNELRHICPADSPFHIVHFSVSPDYFFQFLPENESWPKTLVSKITRKESIMGDRFAPISLAQDRALQNIMDCPLDGKLGQWMIETSIAQIIVLQLSALFQNRSNTDSAISKRDLDTIQTVKEHLAKTFLYDHSLDSLAKNFGTNTSKLMGLFKKSFGKSIFEFIGELKMEHAWHLLKNENRRVVEVARELGYKNPNHFSTAFKKKFGISPSQLA